MYRLKKLLLTFGILLAVSVSSYAGSKYYVDVEGVIHGSTITVVEGLPYLTISTHTKIIGNLEITGDFDNALRVDLDAEIILRISEDDLISDATGQIRIDFEAYDSTLDTSTTTLRTDLDSEIALRASEDNLISDTTGQLRIDLNTEISDRISEDDLISNATNQIRIDFEAYDSTLDTSTTTLRADLVSEIASRISEDNLLDSATNQLQTNIDTEETTRISEDNLLDDATNQLQTNITSEETSRISEDDLISNATGQIRTDFEAYDSTLNTSTTTLRSDLTSEIASRISEDDLISNATGQIRIDFETSTTTLRSDLVSEIASRISEDDLISDATGQIRIDFEAYDSTLNISTATLRSDLVSEIASRISEDDLISDATDQIRIDFEAYDSTLNTSTTTLRGDITNLETSTSTLEGRLNIAETDITNLETSTSTLEGRLDTAETDITNLETSTSTLEGRLDTAETDITNLETSTSTIEGNLVSEIASRILEDNLISNATGQIRIDFEAYDSTLNTSTTTLRTDLISEIASRISEDNLISDATGQIRIDFEAYDSTLNTSTTTLRTDLDSEIASRISEDDLISDATGQMRVDFEAYDSTLNTSTTTLRTDLVSEIASRISEDNLISDATNQIRIDFEAYDSTLDTSTTTLRVDLNIEIVIRANEISSLTTTYLGITDIASDSSLWKTLDIATTTLVINDLLRFDGNNLVRVASGTVVGQYLMQDLTWQTPSGGGDMLRSVYDIGENNIVDNSEALDGQSGSYYAIKTNVISSTDTLQANIDILNTIYLGINAKADDADLLDGYNYSHFVDTVTTQSIGGIKTFENVVIVGDFYIDSLWLKENDPPTSYGMKIYADGDTLKMYQKNEITNTYEFEYNLFRIPGSLYLGTKLSFQYLYFGETTDEYIRGDAANNNIRMGTGGIDRIEVTDSSTTFSVDIYAIGYEVFADTFTGVFIGNTSSSTWADDAGLLDGNDSTYFATDAGLTSEINTRISEDNLISDATGQIRVDLNTEIAIRINEISSLTTTYLGINAKADDSDLLDGFDYLYFVDTVTVQDIGGIKRFSNQVLIGGTTQVVYSLLVSNVVGEWHLNENEGASTTIIDYSGNGYDGISSTWTAVTNITGKINDGYHANNLYNILFGVDTLDMGMQSFTLCGWIKRNGLGHKDYIVGKDAGNPRYGMMIDEFDNLRGYAINGDLVYDAGDTTIEAGVWYFVAVVFDRSEHDLLLYVNGELEGSSYSIGDFSTVGNLDNNNEFRIGWGATRGASYVDGVIDAVFVFDKVLTPTEVMALYYIGYGVETPLGYLSGLFSVFASTFIYQSDYLSSSKDVGIEGSLEIKGGLYGDGSNLTGIFTNDNWEEYFSYDSGNGEVDISTSVNITGDFEVNINLADDGSQFIIRHSSPVGLDSISPIYYIDSREGSTSNNKIEAFVTIETPGGTNFGLYIKNGKLHVDGFSIFGSKIYMNAGAKFEDNMGFEFGSGADLVWIYNNNGTGDDFLQWLFAKRTANDTTAFFMNRDVYPMNMTDHDGYLSPTFVIVNDEGADSKDYAGVIMGERAQADVAVAHTFEFYAMTGSMDGSVDGTTTEIPADFSFGSSDNADILFIDTSENHVGINNLTVNETFYYNASSAEIAMQDNTAGTTVIASTFTFFQIEGTYTSDDLIGFTVAGSSFTYTGLGGANKKFKVDCNTSLLTDTANTISHLAVYKNGDKVSVSSSRKIVIAGDEGNHTIIDTLRLSVGDIIQIRVSGDKSAVITAEHITIIIDQMN